MGGTIFPSEWANRVLRKDTTMLAEYVFLYRDKHIESRFLHGSEIQIYKADNPKFFAISLFLQLVFTTDLLYCVGAVAFW